MRRILVTLALVAAALRGPRRRPGAGRPRPAEAADRRRHRRRRGHRRPARDPGGDRRAAPRRQRHRRRGRGRRRARRRRAVLVRHRRRRLHDDLLRRATARVHTIDSRETAPAAMTPTRSSTTASPRRSTPSASAACASACPARRARGRRRCARTARSSLRRGARSPASTSARDGFVVDQTFFDQTDAANGDLRRLPLDRGALPRPRRHAARRRHRVPQPATSRARTSCSPSRARTRFYRGALARGDREHRHAARRCAPARRARSRPGVMTLADLARYRHRRPRADARRLPRPRRLRHGARRRAAARPSARR